MAREKVVFPPEVEQAVKGFHGSGTDRTERYIVLSYEDPNTLAVVGTGDGGWDEAVQLLKDDETSYVLLRKIHQVEMAVTVKFVYIDWTPDSIRPLRKAVLSVHKATVENLLKPHHVSFVISQRNEITEADILARIGFASGTANYTGEAKQPAAAAPRAAAASSGPRLPDIRATQAQVRFDNEAEFKQAMAAVRDSASPITWLAVSYVGKDTLSFIGSGEGDVENLAQRFEENSVCFGLLKTTDVVDKSVTTKFIYVKYQPTTIPPMKRAAISTQKGAIDAFFAPFHIDFFIEQKSDINAAAVVSKLADATGRRR